MTIEQIRKLCYELYKIDWKKSHMITPEMEKDLVRNYYEEVVFSPDFDGDYSLEDYVFDYGYEGQLYACYDEFLGAEYLDKDYVLTLLPENSDVRILYLQDIQFIILSVTLKDDVYCVHRPFLLFYTLIFTSK